MKLLDKLKRKRAIIKTVDIYMKHLEEQLSEEREIKISYSYNEKKYEFEEYFGGEISKYSISKDLLYAVCQDLEDTSEVKDKIDSYLVQCSYQAMLEKNMQKQ